MASLKECSMRSILLATRLALPTLLVASLTAITAVAGPGRDTILPPPGPPPHAAPGSKASAPPTPANPADGTWQEFNLLQVSNALTAYDATQNRLLSLGGSRASNWRSEERRVGKEGRNH